MRWAEMKRGKNCGLGLGTSSRMSHQMFEVFLGGEVVRPHPMLAEIANFTPDQDGLYCISVPSLCVLPCLSSLSNQIEAQNAPKF